MIERVYLRTPHNRGMENQDVRIVSGPSGSPNPDTKVIYRSYVSKAVWATSNTKTVWTSDL